MTTKIYYSISNGGDGSANPYFFLDEKVAELHQQAENAYEGWGEPCYGLAITIDFKEPVKIKGLMTTKELIEDLEERLRDEFYGEPSGATREVESIVKQLKQIAKSNVAR